MSADTPKRETRLTDEMLQELIASPNADAFIGGLAENPLDLPRFLEGLLRSKGLRKNEVIRRSGLNETFAYQIFSGDRHCTRDKALQLAFAFPLDLDETDHLLMHAGVGELYCRDRRDAIIIFCITHGRTLAQTDDELYAHDERTITTA